MSKLFGNPAGNHIAANLADWRVGQPLGGGIRPRRHESLRQSLRPIEDRLATGEASLDQVAHTGSEVVAVAFGFEAMIENLKDQAQQAASGEIAS